MCSITLLCRPNAKETEKNNDEQNAGVKHSKISTFHFPGKAKNKELFERWRNAVHRTNWFPTENCFM